MQPDDSERPFRVGWGPFLDKYFGNLPNKYTGFYFFEFTRGYVTYRYLATTEDKDAITIKLDHSVDGLRSRILMDLFGKCDSSNLRFEDIKLPVHTGNKLSLDKLKSLSKKYFSIPAKYLDYYPKYVKPIKKGKIEQASKSKKRQLNSKPDAKRKIKRSVGRPKKALVAVPGLQSVTKFFRPVNRS